MKTLNQWTHAHPWKGIGFAVLFTWIATFASFRDDLKWQCLSAYLVGIVAFICVWMWDHRKVIVLGLCLAIPISTLAQSDPPPQEPPPAESELGCAIVVIIVGGLIVYGLNKFCQKHFSPPPKGPNTNTTTSIYIAQDVAPDPDTAASLNASSCGSCSVPTIRGLVVNMEKPVTFEITGQVTENEYQQPLVLIDSARLAPVQTNTMTFADYQAAVAEHGITVTEHGQGESYYGKNGQPTTADQVPISFNTDRSVNVSNGSPPGVILIERSNDLQKWETALLTYVSMGYRFRFVDTSLAPQTFYRVSTR